MTVSITWSSTENGSSIDEVDFDDVTNGSETTVQTIYFKQWFQRNH